MAEDLRRGLLAQALRSRGRFLEAISGSAARLTQSEVLDQCLVANRETDFGKSHSFSRIGDIDNFRAAVPIRSYHQLAPWIDRAAAGEPAILTAESPIRFWKTTGTTASPKKIPVTPASANRTLEAFLAFQGSLLSYYPELSERSDTTLATHVSPKPIREYLGSRKYPYCTTTEVPLQIRPGRERHVAPWLHHLESVVEDDSERLYYLLLYASLHDLYSIACLHPSRFETIARSLARNAVRLIDELKAGTLLEEPFRAPQPEKAALFRAKLEQTGSLLPRDLWPNLKCLTSWSGAYIDRYWPTMKAAYCSGFLPTPSVSSEVFLSMTIDDNLLGQPLNLRGGVFEFVPSDQTVEAGTPTLQFWELSEGATYEVIVTTLAGLYRYATADIFRVSGFYDQVPRMEYIGRRSVSDLTGEKLAEEQVCEAMRTAVRELEMATTNFTVCGISRGPGALQPGYVLVLEAPVGQPWSSSQGLADRLDAILCTINSRYQLKRSFQDLACLAVRYVSAGTFARYRQQRIQAGTPAGQLKDTVLYPHGAEPLARLLELSSLLEAEDPTLGP